MGLSAIRPPDNRVRGMSIGTELLLLRLRRLSNLPNLNAAELALVSSVTEGSRMHLPGSLISSGGEGGTRPRLIVSGWACRPRLLADGRRQVLDILLPGDIIGDRGDQRPIAMSPAEALTCVRTVSASKLYEALARDAKAYPVLASAVACFERSEEGRLLDHIVRLGCQTALQRMAHCLMELYARLEAIGFTSHGTFPMLLKQEVLGEFLGLSLVHVNRIMAQLKREGLIAVRSGVAVVQDLERLALLADCAIPTRMAEALDAPMLDLRSFRSSL